MLRFGEQRAKPDGTVLSPHGHGSHVEALAAYGEGPDSRGFEDRLVYIRRTTGRSRLDVFRALVEDEDCAQRANHVFELAIEAAVAQGSIEPVDGARETIEALREQGVAVCLATGYSQRTLDGIVEALGWRDVIDGALAPGLQSDGRGLRGRPHPDLVLAAVMETRIDAVSEVAVVGDAVSDLVSGTRAGASVVAGVLTGVHTREELARAPHTHVLDGVWELPGVVLDVSAPLSAA
jgi:phosphonatase-like hydrolase